MRREAAPAREEAEELIAGRLAGDGRSARTGEWRPSVNELDVIELIDDRP